MYSALKEMSQARYRIEEEGTNGYSVLRFGMTREECQDAWEYYVATGTNPERLRIVRES